jgi:hypothetical protein
MSRANTFQHEIRFNRALNRARKRLGPAMMMFQKSLDRLANGFFPLPVEHGSAQVPHLYDKGHMDALNAGAESAWKKLEECAAYRYTSQQLRDAVMRECKLPLTKKRRS